MMVTWGRDMTGEPSYHASSDQAWLDAVTLGYSSSPHVPSISHQATRGLQGLSHPLYSVLQLYRRDRPRIQLQYAFNKWELNSNGSNFAVDLVPAAMPRGDGSDFWWAHIQVCEVLLLLLFLVCYCQLATVACVWGLHGACTVACECAFTGVCMWVMRNETCAQS